MRLVKTTLNIVVLDFESFAKEIEDIYNAEVKKTFGIFTDFASKDTKRLYLYYTFKYIQNLHKTFGNKNVVIYIEKKERVKTHIFNSLIELSRVLPIMIYYGDYSFELIEKEKGEFVEVTKEVTQLRLDTLFETYTQRKLNNFCKSHGINVFTKVSKK